MKPWCLGVLASLAVISRAGAQVPSETHTTRLDRLENAWTSAVRVREPSHPTPDDAPHVILHAPTGFDPNHPVDLMIFLHGYSGCIEVLARSGEVACRPGQVAESGWGLLERHDAAETNSLFIVPQLSFRERNGHPGRFLERGFARRFLEQLLTEHLPANLFGQLTDQRVRAIHLLVHSAGYEAALAWVRHGDLGRKLRTVVLFDALYAGAPAFVEWLTQEAEAAAIPTRRLISFYTGGPTRAQTHAARRLLSHDDRVVVSHDPVDLSSAIRSSAFVSVRSSVSHRNVPAYYLPVVLPEL